MQSEVLSLERERFPRDTIVERYNSLQEGNTHFAPNTHEIFLQKDVSTTFEGVHMLISLLLLSEFIFRGCISDDKTIRTENRLDRYSLLVSDIGRDLPTLYR